MASWQRLDYRGQVCLADGYLKEVGNFADLRGPDPDPEVSDRLYAGAGSFTGS